VAPALGWLSGGFTSVSFKPEGSRVLRGSSLGWAEGPRHFDVVRAPFDCEVTSVNRGLLATPRLLNKDPYGAGWFALVRSLVGPTELKSLEEAAGSIEKRLRELGVQCFSEFPDHELFEIGVECSAVLVSLNELLAGAAEGTTVHIVSDDPTASIEMERWSDQTGNVLVESRKDDLDGRILHFVAKKQRR